MRVLVIGGTRFVGRHIVEAALASGHEVTLLHRGRTGADLFPRARHLHADRDVDLSVLSEGEWDATVDVCAYWPAQVRSLAAALGRRAGRYALISSVSAYAPLPGPGANEDAPLAELVGPEPVQMSNEAYGALKVRCERAAREAFGSDVLILRPTYVVGPHDHTGRFTHWVLRLARGGEVLAPGPHEGPIQVIDARDLASFAVGLFGRRSGGVFHVASPAPPFGFADLLGAIATAVAPAGTHLTWVDESFLRSEGETTSSLPLWSGSDEDRFALALDPSRALAAGLSPRPLGETAADTLRWARAAGAISLELSAEREAELLARWHSR
ncbi:MAG: NAD-dependent epimerase/dehydratase family protein [Deltaproteobacteria bacterium]|nr:NAD-dependent epimerase/dehydratase family protein [Deltaproteobacteria bacterium]